MIQTDIDYPKGLPVPLREEYGIKHISPLKRTTMASGRSRSRRAFGSVPSIVNVAWIFPTDNLAALFEAWYRDTINDGADWFNMPLKTPIGMQDYVCKFVDIYDEIKLVGVSSWRISAQLEIWERPLMPQGWGLLPEFVLGASIFDIAMNREWPEK